MLPSRKLDDLCARSAAILHALGGIMEALVKRVQPERSRRSASAADVHQAITNFKSARFFADKSSPASIHDLALPERRLGLGIGELQHRSVNQFKHSFVENRIVSPRPTTNGRNSGRQRFPRCPEELASRSHHDARE